MRKCSHKLPQPCERPARYRIWWGTHDDHQKCTSLTCVEHLEELRLAPGYQTPGAVLHLERIGDRQPDRR